MTREDGYGGSCVFALKDVHYINLPECLSLEFERDTGNLVYLYPGGDEYVGMLLFKLHMVPDQGSEMNADGAE